MKVLGFLIVLFLIVVGVMSTNKPTSTAAPPTPTSYTIVPPRHVEKLELAPMKWERGGFGSVAIAAFTIKNKNTFSVKDIEVECEFYGNSGTRINKRSVTLYETIKGGQTRTIKNVNIGFIDPQVAKGGCTLVRAST